MAKNQLIVAATLAFALPDAQALADGVETEMQKEIFAGWAELEKMDEARPAVDTVWTVRESGGRTDGTRSGEGRFRRNGSCSRISGNKDDGKVEEFVLNPKYVFYVLRDPNSVSWTLRFVESDLESANAKQLQEGFNSAKVVAPTAAVLLGSALRQQRKPSAVVDDPEFKVTKIDRLADGHVRVHYQHRLLVGEFDCDPAMSYVIKRGRSVEKGKRLECLMTFERHFDPLGPPGHARVLRLVSEVIDTPGSTRAYETTYSYPDVSKTGELDEERFRLTAYGLPEPEGVVWEKPRRWLPYWLVGTGVVILVATTWVIRRTRRVRPVEARP